MKKMPALLATAALLSGVVTAQAATESCDDPLKSSLGQRFCTKVFDDLAPGLYNVSFQYQAEKLTGNSDRNLSFAFLFDTDAGSPILGLLSDSTSTPGWNSYSFTTQAGGDGLLSFGLLSFASRRYELALQNIQVSAVPEPATYALLLAGLGALMFISRRRRP